MYGLSPVATSSKVLEYQEKLGFFQPETDKYLFVCNDFSKDEDNYLISPDVPVKFTVSEYIEHFAHCEKMSIAELSKKTSIQKTAFLVI